LHAEVARVKNGGIQSVMEWVNSFQHITPRKPAKPTNALDLRPLPPVSVVVLCCIVIEVASTRILLAAAGP
jgi:hypothetical protein